MKRTPVLLLVGGLLLLLLAACGADPPATIATETPTADPTAAPATAAPTEPPPDTATAPPPTDTMTPEPTAEPTDEPTASPVPATDTPPPPTEAPTEAPTVAPAASIAISIEDFLFTPGRQTVRVGDTVTWSHVGNARHTVTADDGSFDSGSLSGGGTFSFTFDAAGTYAYYCRLHGAPGAEGMSAVITVTE